MVSALALAENQLVVILIHLGNVLFEQIAILIIVLLLLILLVKLLCCLHWVEDGGVDRHCLLKVGRCQLAELGVRRDKSLHSQRVGVSLCKKSSLQTLLWRHCLVALCQSLLTVDA